MKLGLIFACPLGGTDQKVYGHIIEQLNPKLQITTQSAGKDKKEMIQNCGKIAKLLLNDQCDYIAIIWDLMPAWGGEACRREDVGKILTKLSEKQVDLSKIKLICIEPELESIFLIDGNVLTNYKQQLSNPHPINPFKGKKLTKKDNGAKTCISNYLERKYNDISEAIKITQHIKNYGKIAKKHDSFKRLKEFIESLH